MKKYILTILVVLLTTAAACTGGGSDKVQENTLFQEYRDWLMQINW